MKWDSLCYVNVTGIVSDLRSYSEWGRYLYKQVITIKYAVMGQILGAMRGALNPELVGKGFL